MLRSHRDLKVWQAAMELAVSVYRATEKFPRSELFGLVSQMRRSAGSIPANIAEGFSRQYRREFIQFLHIAKGSLGELDTQLDLSLRLGYLDSSLVNSFTQQMDAVGKMIHGLMASLRKDGD